MHTDLPLVCNDSKSEAPRPCSKILSPKAKLHELKRSDAREIELLLAQAASLVKAQELAQRIYAPQLAEDFCPLDLFDIQEMDIPRILAFFLNPRENHAPKGPCSSMPSLKRFAASLLSTRNRLRRPSLASAR